MFTKNSRSTQDRQSDNYSLQEQSFVYEMIKNSYPSNFRVNSVIPFSRASQSGFTGQTFGTNISLYGRLDITIGTGGDQIRVHVINDLGQDIELVYESPAAGTTAVYTYFGVITYITVGVPDAQSSWSFNGWKIDLAKDNSVVTPSAMEIVFTKNTLSKWFDETEYAFETCTAISGYSVSGSSQNSILTLAGRDDTRVLLRVSRPDNGTFLEHYPEITCDQPTLTVSVISAIADAGVTGYWFVTLQITGLLSVSGVTPTVNLNAYYFVPSEYTWLQQTCVSGATINFDGDISRSVGAAGFADLDNQPLEVFARFANDIGVEIGTITHSWTDADTDVEYADDVPALGGGCDVELFAPVTLTNL